MINKIVIFYFMLLIFTIHNACAKDINLTGIYKTEPCNISIEIANANKTGYFYRIVDNNQTKSEGYISNIKSNGEGEFYVKFKNFQAAYENDTLVIQNYGNSMNQYIHFEDCDSKYLKFDKLLSAHPRKSSLTTVFGDLDGDNIEEKVLISENNDGQRMLQIFKQNNSSEWKLWHSFDNIVINSDDGGAMGDPFAELSVSNRVISVSHDGGGGRFTWQYLHKYRYDKKDKIWKVVGATITHLDKSKKVETLDYNLLTGKAIYTANCIGGNEDQDECMDIKNFTFYVKPPNSPLMKNFKIGKNKIVIPKFNIKMYY